MDQERIEQTLTLDKMGRVKLGPLKGMETLWAQVRLNGVTFKETWRLMNETDLWTQPEEINIVAGESVEVPINYEG